jgi:hypothetical protein
MPKAESKQTLIVRLKLSAFGLKLKYPLPVLAHFLALLFYG